MYSISVIVPVYNEARLVKKAVYKIDRYIRDIFTDYEIIIIESGSTDGTAEEVDLIKKGLKSVKVIHEGSRNGFGSAIKLGFKKANKDLAVMITTDLPFPLTAINKALPQLQKYDCVLSYRSSDKRSIYRKVQSYVYNLIVKIVLGLKMKHINSGFKLYKKRIYKNLKIMSNGWFIDTEILFRIKTENISYVEIPVKLIEQKDHKSSTNIFTPFSLVEELVRFLLYR